MTPYDIGYDEPEGPEEPDWLYDERTEAEKEVTDTSHENENENENVEWEHSMFLVRGVNSAQYLIIDVLKVKRSDSSSLRVEKPWTHQALRYMK